MPFESKAQQRWMFAAEARGDVPAGTARRWTHHTPNMKALPARVAKDRPKRMGDTKGPEKRAEALLAFILGPVEGAGKASPCVSTTCVRSYDADTVLTLLKRASAATPPQATVCTTGATQGDPSVFTDVEKEAAQITSVIRVSRTPVGDALVLSRLKAAAFAQNFARSRTPKPAVAGSQASLSPVATTQGPVSATMPYAQAQQQLSRFLPPRQPPAPGLTTGGQSPIRGPGSKSLALPEVINTFGAIGGSDITNGSQSVSPNYRWA